MKAASQSLSALARRTPEPPISWLMKMTLDHPQLISLAAGFTDSESLPVREAHHLLQHMLRSAKTARSSLQYGSTQGDPVLRRLTAEHVQREDGSDAGRVYAPGRTLITHGSQQLLYLVTECLCDPGDIVLVEDPTYFVYLGIAQSHGLRCRGIPLTPDGLDLAALERTLESLKSRGELKRVKLLYLVSYFQNPSGVTTSFAKKQAALALLRRYERAAGHPIYLLEDAAYRELRFAGEDTKSALAEKRFGDRVIYAGTYSKPFASGVRVGFGLLPEPVFAAAVRVKGNHDFGTSNLLQQLLAAALASCRYKAHLPIMRARYAKKAAVMVRAIRRHFPAGVRWVEPRGGLYVWASLPAEVRSGVKSKLFRAALRDDVLYVPGELCYAEDPTRPRPDCDMRLSFGGATEADIRRGIARLGAVLHRWID
jgi:2-aminoadipate transaminase